MNRPRRKRKEPYVRQDSLGTWDGEEPNLSKRFAARYTGIPCDSGIFSLTGRFADLLGSGNGYANVIETSLMPTGPISIMIRKNLFGPSRPSHVHEHLIRATNHFY